MTTDNNVVPFPNPEEPEAKPRPRLFERLCWRVRSNVRCWIGRALQRAGVPGVVGNMAMDDLITGAHVEVRVGMLFTVFSVDGRDYYFDRFTGRFDGTGIGCGCSRDCSLG